MNKNDEIEQLKEEIKTLKLMLWIKQQRYLRITVKHWQKEVKQ